MSRKIRVNVLKKDYIVIEIPDEFYDEELGLTKSGKEYCERKYNNDACRLSSIYLIDDDGFPGECLYE